MYCRPVSAQWRRKFYSTATSRFFTYRGGVWNALIAINEGTLYLFVINKHKIICPVCREMVAVPKKYDLRQHLETQLPTILKLDRNEKSLKAAGLMKSLGKEQQFFKVFDNESAKAANVNFQISRKIAASGRYFTDVGFVKKCTLVAVSELCPEKMRMFQNISPSRMTIQRR